MQRGHWFPQIPHMAVHPREQDPPPRQEMGTNSRNRYGRTSERTPNHLQKKQLRQLQKYKYKRTNCTKAYLLNRKNPQGSAGARQRHPPAHRSYPRGRIRVSRIPGTSRRQSREMLVHPNLLKNTKKKHQSNPMCTRFKIKSTRSPKYLQHAPQSNNARLALR